MSKSLIRRNSDKTKESKGLSFGFISLFLVMIVLCLTIFSLLSFSTANSDYKLTKRSADTVLSYYEAEAKIQQTLAEIHDLCNNDKSTQEMIASLNQPEAITSSADDTIVLTQAMNEKQYIEVTLKIQEKNYSITSYLLKIKEEITDFQ